MLYTRTGGDWMGSRGVNRSLYSALFDDPDFQALPAAARQTLLTARLCPQAGPGAIFICYPEILARQTGLSLRCIEGALKALEEAGWIQRESLILWVINGLRYDPTLRLADPKHRKAVTRSIASLPRLDIILRFCDYYGIPRPFDAPSETKAGLALPKTENREPRTQNREPRTENREPNTAGAPADTAQPAPALIQFRIPASVSEALDRAPRLGADRRIRTPVYWQALVRAHGGVDYGHEVLRAEAWMVANPGKAPRKDLARFLASWIGRAERPDEEQD